MRETSGAAGEEDVVRRSARPAVAAGGAGADILGYDDCPPSVPSRPVLSARTSGPGMSERPLPLRIAGGVLCGVLALVLNHYRVPMLSPETPEFAFGGAFVLFAYWQLGVVPGIVAAVVGYAVYGGVREAMLAAIVMYAVEGYVTSRLAARTRSLVVADVLFWVTGGALLDLLIFRWWMGLSGGYVLLLLVKQLLNGVMNAAVADGASRLTVVRRWIGAPSSPSRSWRDVLFDRTVPVVMVPMTIIVLLLARASYAAQFNRVSAELRQAVTSAREGADQFLQSRLASVQALVRDLGPSLPRSSVRAETILRAFHASHSEFLNFFVTDAGGTVLVSSPDSSTTGVPNRGRSIARRPYFEESRATRRPVIGELVMGQLHLLRPGVEPILPLAVPLLTVDGSFGGVVMGALDAGTLRAILSARTGALDGAVQLLDRVGRVVASTSGQWTPGAQRGPELSSVLGDSVSQLVAVPTHDTVTHVDRLGVNPRLTVAQRVSGFPFIALVDDPLASLHEAMIPTSLALIVLMLGALLVVYAVARWLDAQLATPLQAIGSVAEDLAGGNFVPRGVLAEFEASPVQEIRALAAQFVVMDEALRGRREADASAVQRSESKYRETLEQLAQAQKMEGIGRLAGGIAHDFNNLLTPILGYTDLAMAAVPEGNPVRKDLALVRTAAGRAKEVVAQLLAFGRAQVLEVRRMDLSEVVAEFEPLLRRTLSASVELSVIAEPGIVVEADRAKVQQVLMNLVINAADSMPDGGRVEVRVGLEEILVPDLSNSEPLAVATYGALIVSDTGSGMDEETRRKAFDPFFTTKPRGKGTGLGLSTAYGIARQHRGTIMMESSPGAGTQMRVLLPLAAPAPFGSVEVPPVPKAAARIVAPLLPGTTTTVLVVEDEDSVCELVRVALTRAGFRILVAHDGTEALMVSASEPGRIDLLLTDVVMPGLNGRELARRFRATRPDARVLFMSGYAADVIAAEGELLGDADLLVKPFSPDELVERVRTALHG